MSDPQLPPFPSRGHVPSTAAGRRTLAIIIAVVIVGALAAGTS